MERWWATQWFRVLLWALRLVATVSVELAWRLVVVSKWVLVFRLAGWELLWADRGIQSMRLRSQWAEPQLWGSE